jgi:hypothetical protein
MPRLLPAGEKFSMDTSCADAADAVAANAPRQTAPIAVAPAAAAPMPAMNMRRLKACPAPAPAFTNLLPDIVLTRR